jgi:tRNA pseudouridine55 synthase
MTTFDLIRRLEWRFKFHRIGHTGTLDPLATGLVVLCVNEATKLARYLGEGPKVYECGLRLGERRDTLDADGLVVATAPVPVLGAGEMREALARFVGDVSQVPPMYSAVKVDGERLYRAARRGEEVDAPARTVRIDAIDLIGGAGADWKFRATVSRGTYIRTLVDDLGVALGTFAYVTSLRRVENGGFHVSQAVNTETLQGAEALAAALLPTRTVMQGYPSASPDEAALALFRNGGFLPCAPELPDGQPVIVLDPAGELVGTAAPFLTSEGERVLKPERVLLS